MDINQVKFGNYTVGNFGARQPKANENKNNEGAVPQQSTTNNEQVNPEEFFNALNIAGLQNKIKINQVKNKEVDPADFLSEERIASIEAMMAEFESGVESISEIVGEEIPGISDANKYALAARIYAKE